MPRTRTQDIAEDVKAILSTLLAAAQVDNLIAFGDEWFEIKAYLRESVLGGKGHASIEKHQMPMSNRVILNLTIDQFQHKFVLRKLSDEPRYPKGADKCR